MNEQPDIDALFVGDRSIPVHVSREWHTDVPEGQECPTCRRRVPKKKKPSSPKTKVVSLRVPIDDAETFAELLEAAAKNANLYEKGHWMFWTVHRGLVHVLQEPPSHD